ncbi:MAG: nitroreductase/quinone reductase family protein [Actinobacteria bacterium]|nr:nitroreductase/quinone reductase family protein [Actinomycetota bacterium]
MLSDRLAVRREERLMWKLVRTGSRQGTSVAGRAGDVASKPLAWASFAAAVSLTGRRGRRAVVRGAACSAAASVIHLPIKRVVGRPRPRGARLIGGPGPLTSSFPSGHTASDLAFLLGAAQELPLLLIPGTLATACSHWSLIRTRKHYPSDIIAGGAIAIAVTAAAWKLRPPLNRHTDRQVPSPAQGRTPAGRHPVKRAAMRFVTNQLLNRLTRPLLERGLWPHTQALIETTGRTSGLPRRVPVGNGLRDKQFWIVTEHGYGADYVRNIQQNPRMRVKVGRHWHAGTAQILHDDDARARLRWLKRPVNDAVLLLIGTQQLTIRVDLDR